MECDICLEPMNSLERRPKILPCGHTFCLRCLNAQENQTCADCRKVYRIRASDLLDNFFVLRLSENRPDEPSGPRLWCRECGEEATEVCSQNEHQISYLKKVRSAQKQPRLDALRRGEESLQDVRTLVEELAPDLGVAVADCSDVLRRDQDGVVAKRRRLQAAQATQDSAVWQMVLDASEPSVLSQRAGQLMAVLADPASSCSVALRGGGVAFTANADPKDSLAKLLLCRLLCAGKLLADETPAALSPVAATEAPRWQERTNESVEEMAARMKVGSRVVRGRDWKPGCTHDGTPPGPGTVTSINDDGTVDVTWDCDTDSLWYYMGFEKKYELKLLGTPTPSEIFYEEEEIGLQLEDTSSSLKLMAALNPLTKRRLDKVRSLVGLQCGLCPRKVLQEVAPSVEVLGLDSPEEHHLQVVRAMPKLRELHVRLPSATQQQLQMVLQMPKLSRLEVHCPFEAPLPPPSAPLPAVGLKWLRVGVYPLATALALVRANADTLEELELVAASTEPYGCPDLAGELRKCRTRRMRTVLLVRNSISVFCRHDTQTCPWQKMDMKNSFKESGRHCEVLCSECDNDPLQ